MVVSDSFILGKRLSDRLDDLVRRSIRVHERNGWFICLRGDQRRELAVEETRGKEMILPGGESSNQFLSINLEEQNLHSRIDYQNLPIFRLQRGAGDYGGGLCLKSSPQQVG